MYVFNAILVIKKTKKIIACLFVMQTVISLN